MNLAARGARHMDDGISRIQEKEELLQVRRQARRVYIKSAVFALLVTLASLALP